MSGGSVDAGIVRAPQQRDVEETERFLESCGLALLESGGVDQIRAAAASLPLDRRRGNAIALCVEAMDESNAGRHDLAESWFRTAMVLAGKSEAGTRIAYHLAGDLVRRRRVDAVALLESLADAPASPLLRGQIAARLGTAYAFAGRHDEARAQIAAALSLVSGGEPLAGVFQNAAIVALQRRDPDAAEGYANRAGAVAEECGLDYLAATALSVSYEVALSYRDDANAALATLERIEACASRSQSSFFRRYVLFGRIEIAAEQGEADRLARLERLLADEEIENDITYTQQALVPSNALRASWSGDFIGAYRLLAANAEAHRSQALSVLRGSEIALYGAAAGLGEAAAAAFAAARKSLPPAGDPSALAARARLNLALAAALLGERRTAITMISGAGGLERWPRLRSYREAIRSLVRWSRWAAPDELLERLSALRQVGFGGMAAMLEALPRLTYTSSNDHAGCTS